MKKPTLLCNQALHLSEIEVVAADNVVAANEESSRLSGLASPSKGHLSPLAANPL
jgi:hypothetical protein